MLSACVLCGFSLCICETKIVPDHYKQEEGQQDWLDRCINTMPPSQLLGAMKFTIGKYNDRLGEKDSEIDELTKIINYSTRYRNHLINKGNK